MTERLTAEQRKMSPLSPLANDAELDAAIETLNGLLDCGDMKRAAELGDLIEAYEREHHKIPPVSKVQQFRHLMEDG